MSAADDALDVARFCWPEFAADLERMGVPWRADHEDIAAAERVLVERGLGEEYGRALAEVIPNSHVSHYMGLCWVRTAPPEVCLRAMARVVREKQPKETK